MKRRSGVVFEKEDVLTLHLDWKGPFCLATSGARQAFAPPSEGGVYLWCVGRDPVHRVSYVGQAVNLRDRMYQHIFWTLGGAYRLYSDGHLVDGSCPVPEYEGGLENILTVFLADFGKYSATALHNLQSYSFFWVAIPGERSIRQAVESALITEAKRAGEPLQNDKRSRTPAKSRRLMIVSSFQCGAEVAGIPIKINYGELD